MCHGNVDVIVQADRHHQGIKEMVTVWPSADDAQIHIDFCWGLALHSTHTLALVIGLSIDLLARMIVCSLSDRYTAPICLSPCQVSCGKMNRLAFSPDPPICSSRQ